MKQGIMGPTFIYPFLIPNPIRPVDSTEKQAISNIMNELQGFSPESPSQTIVCWGFIETPPVPHAFQFSSRPGAPRTATERISSVLIGDDPALARFPPILRSGL